MAPKAKPKGGGARTSAHHKRRHNEVDGRKEAVLAALAQTGIVQAACDAAGVGRRTFYDWTKEDAEFAKLAGEARESAADLLEQEARRRAHDGTDKPVYQGGKRVGVVREYSDTLLIFLLKGCRPEKYRERADSVNLNVDYSQLTDQQLERIRNGESPLAVVGRR